MMSESLLGVISEHVQTMLVVGLEITSGVSFDQVSSEIGAKAFEPHCRFSHGVLYQSQT